MEHRNDNIEIIGASENNLKHIDVTIPKGTVLVSPEKSMPHTLCKMISLVKTKGNAVSL